MTITLVTGANKGIGFETARQLATLGHHVILAGRDEQRVKSAADVLKAEGLTVEPLVLDVTNATSIAAAHDHIKKTHGVLDVLVNNAGVMRDGTVRVDTAQVEDWRTTFDTNVFGIVALTTALIPLLRQSSAGRIVNVSSILGSAQLNGDANSPFGDYTMMCTAYNASKAAVNIYTAHLARALKDAGVKVNAAHPGWVKTDMGGEAAPLTPDMGAKTLVQLANLPNDGPSGAYQHMGENLPW